MVAHPQNMLAWPPGLCLSQSFPRNHCPVSPTDRGLEEVVIPGVTMAIRLVLGIPWGRQKRPLADLFLWLHLSHGTSHLNSPFVPCYALCMGLCLCLPGFLIGASGESPSDTITCGHCELIAPLIETCNEVTSSPSCVPSRDIFPEAPLLALSPHKHEILPFHLNETWGQNPLCEIGFGEAWAIIGKCPFWEVLVRSRQTNLSCSTKKRPGGVCSEYTGPVYVQLSFHLCQCLLSFFCAVTLISKDKNLCDSGIPCNYPPSLRQDNFGNYPLTSFLFIHYLFPVSFLQWFSVRGSVMEWLTAIHTLCTCL